VLVVQSAGQGLLANSFPKQALLGHSAAVGRGQAGLALRTQRSWLSQPRAASRHRSDGSGALRLCRRVEGTHRAPRQLPAVRDREFFSQAGLRLSPHSSLGEENPASCASTPASDTERAATGKDL